MILVRAAIARACVLIVLTLDGDRICAITYFGDRGLFPRFGLPRTLPSTPGRRATVSHRDVP